MSAFSDYILIIWLVDLFSTHKEPHKIIFKNKWKKNLKFCDAFADCEASSCSSFSLSKSINARFWGLYQQARSVPFFLRPIQHSL